MMKYLKKFENTEPEKIIEYYDNGNVKLISYKQHNKYHRKNGPAYQSWFQNGQQKKEAYFINGKYHREDGPAYQEWYKNELKYEEYYIDGDDYKKEEWIKKLKVINSPHYEEQKMIYDMEKNIKKYNL